MTTTLLLLSLLAGQPAPPDPSGSPPRDSWAQIVKSPALRGPALTIDFIRDPADDKAGEYTLRLTQRDREGPPTTKWASSRTCRAVKQAVARFDTLPFPKVARPDAEIEVVMDGVGYAVTFDALYGRQATAPMTLRSNVGTPLAAWIDGTLAVLDPCWSPKRAD